MSGTLKKVGIPIIILLAAFVILAVMIYMKPAPEKKEVVTKAFLVEAQSIFTENVEFLVYAQGAVTPKHRTMLSAQVSGTVVSVSDKFDEGGFFKEGDVLVELESDDYETDLLLAEAEVARAQAAFDEEIARSKVAAKEWSSINSGTPPELGLRKPQLAREQANVKAAMANLARAKRNLTRTQITAPYDGLVKSKMIDIGQFVPMGAQIGEVFSTGTAQVRLPLTDNDVAFIGDLKTEQPMVSLSADVAGKRHFWQGTLVRDEAVLDEARRVIYGVVEISDPYNLQGNQHPNRLKFGRFVSAAISGLTANDVIKLPRYVLRLDGTVLTVTEEDTIHINSVEVMRADEDFVYISAGLPVNHKVVMSAVSTPYNGMPVRFTKDKPTKAINSENEQGGEVRL
ncbi:MAG: RND family efflux transporter MFP subunit [Alphaproteobacteria bacterium]|jgi:RND family efflux transporter MFP subunit